MRPSVHQYAHALVDAIESGGEPALLAQRLRALLQKRRATRLLPRILRAATGLLQTSRGSLAVSIETARPFEMPALSREIGAALKSDVTVHARVRPELKGGAVLRVGDTRVDGSLAQMLASLRHTLSRASKKRLLQQ